MYLDTSDKKECFGCEVCVTACPKESIRMEEDDEGFRYPTINLDTCVECGLCRKICPHDNLPPKYDGDKYAFGGYISESDVRFDSTSGGAFSAVLRAFCEGDYVVFGAEAKGINVFHSYVTDIRDTTRFRKSKYSQSIIGSAYKDTKRFLEEGKKVLFSGTPCQISGLVSYLGPVDTTNLLTVEVICEGVPSPLYVRKIDEDITAKYGSPIDSLDYRYTGRSVFGNGKWDFQGMKMTVGNKVITKDRWFNPFWYIWLDHLMSRPSCYQCKFTTTGRVADITLGDLWGVHLYCPELYGKNGGSSLVVCNSSKGKEVFSRAREYMTGHELRFEDALKYQSPMRKTISNNPLREDFMKDLKSDVDIKTINDKWARKPTLKLLYQKYIWGNRQKIFWWNLRHGALVKKGDKDA